ncbi:stealth family protein [Legionella sp. CNM-4043-24]|uniref:stealth family protein n=1 Tax=Legionella sp. CNM-4043-24 TaxID=3421646 RepID=UPI00403B0801
MTHTNEPVDAVITWVDGHDPVHREKLSRHLASLGISRPVAADPTRFNQCGELEYCIKSILRYAPWMRTIYLITDAQTPSFTTEFPKDKIKLIDHSDIFTGFESCLPTFNSLSIESVFWRIPGLAERFVYFNDDSFLIRPVRYEDFFRGENLVLRGHWKTQSQNKWRNRIKNWLPFIAELSFLKDAPNEHRNLQENSARLAGWHKQFFHQPHAPFPIRKSILEEFFKENPGLLANNVRFALRDPEQFMSVSLTHHLAMKDRRITIDSSLDAVTINAACHSLKKIHQRLHMADKNSKVAFMCMQSLDAAPPEVQSELLNWLEQSRSGEHHESEPGSTQHR